MFGDAQSLCVGLFIWAREKYSARDSPVNRGAFSALDIFFSSELMHRDSLFTRFICLLHRRENHRHLSTVTNLHWFIRLICRSWSESFMLGWAKPTVKIIRGISIAGIKLWPTKKKKEQLINRGKMSREKENSAERCYPRQTQHPTATRDIDIFCNVFFWGHSRKQENCPYLFLNVRAYNVISAPPVNCFHRE